MENDTDLTQSDLGDIASNWTDSFNAVKHAVLENGGFSWQQLVGNSTCQGALIHNDIKRNSSGGVIQNNSGQCASQLRTACLADSPYQKGALMFPCNIKKEDGFSTWNSERGRGPARSRARAVEGLEVVPARHAR